MIVLQILGATAAVGAIGDLLPGAPSRSHSPLEVGFRSIEAFIKMLLIAKLVFTIFMLAIEKHSGTFLAPVWRRPEFLLS